MKLSDLLEKKPEPYVLYGKKCRIRQTVWGNWYGYCGNKKVIEFGELPTDTSEQQATEWLKQQKESYEKTKSV